MLLTVLAFAAVQASERASERRATASGVRHAYTNGMYNSSVIIYGYYVGL